MRRVMLVLASGPGFPMGSPDHRYDVMLQLDGASRLNPELWYHDKNPWPVIRYWPGAAPREGTVQHDKEGGWSLHFDPRPGLRQDPPLHCPIRTTPFMRPGEYLTILEPDNQEYGYRIVSVV
jgi:hypothetical protein